MAKQTRAATVAKGAVYRAVIVELDGHDYHERTKEQVIGRNQRDRDFQDKGYLVLHFSGTELYRDPFGVIGKVGDVAMDEFAAFRKGLPATPRPMDNSDPF